MTSLEKWRSITQPPEVVEFFHGLFDRAGVRVTDPGEAFTCVHRGDRIDFEPDLDPARVDYVVEVTTGQVDRLAGHVRAGRLDEAERYRIVTALFTPATAATQRHPVLCHPMVHWLSGAENLIHARLVPPAGAGAAGGPPAAHTLVYAHRQWLVFPGLHGRPARTFRLAVADALEFHRRAFALLKTNTAGEWVRFGRWYRRWRKGVSTRP